MGHEDKAQLLNLQMFISLPEKTKYLRVENVNNFVYLGSRIDADGKSSTDIRRRIAIAISKLNTMAPLWKSQSTELKWRTLKACIFHVAIYGCEAWTISKTDEKKITSFKMKCYRKILRISWTKRKTNASVLEQLGLKPHNF